MRRLRYHASLILTSTLYSFPLLPICRQSKITKTGNMDTPRSKQDGRSVLKPLIAATIDKTTLFTLLVYIGNKNMSNINIFPMIKAAMTIQCLKTNSSVYQQGSQRLRTWLFLFGFVFCYFFFILIRCYTTIVASHSSHVLGVIRLSPVRRTQDCCGFEAS